MPDDHIKRCDVRVPIDLYNQIEKIAVEEYNAPTYHKTGKPQVSSTIIELLKLGIANLRGEVSVSISDKQSDTLVRRVSSLESVVEELKVKFECLTASVNPSNDLDRELEADETLSDILSDTKKPTFTLNLSDNLSGNLSELKDVPDTVSDSSPDKEASAASTESTDGSTTKRLPDENELEATKKESQDIKPVEAAYAKNKPNKEQLLGKGYLTKDEMCELWGCKSRKMDGLIKKSKDRGDNPPYIELDGVRYFYEKLEPKKTQKVFRLAN